MFSVIIRAWLKKQERSQAWLARKAKIDPTYLSMILNGKRNPGMKAIERLENAMGLPRGIFVSPTVKTNNGAKPVSERRRLAGKIGGRVTLERYGREHMAKIGKLGGRPTWRESVDKAWQRHNEATERARRRKER